MAAAMSAGRLPCSPSFYKKHQTGKPLTSGERQIVLNVYVKFCEWYPEKPVKELVKYVSECTGVSQSSVLAIVKQRKVTGKLEMPGKQHKVVKRVDKYIDFEISAIRRKVHGFFFKNELPTLRKLQTEINDDDDLPNFSRTTLHRLMHDIGFVFKKRNRETALIDRDYIIL